MRLCATRASPIAVVVGRQADADPGSSRGGADLSAGQPLLRDRAAHAGRLESVRRARRMGWPRVQAICDFVHGHLTFGYQYARATKTANEAYRERNGVCRDFAHLALTLCRCMNIPARYCTGYLGDIGVPIVDSPMDFSGWFEAFLDGQLVHLRRPPQRAAHRSHPHGARARCRRRRDRHQLRREHGLPASRSGRTKSRSRANPLAGPQAEQAQQARPPHYSMLSRKSAQEICGSTRKKSIPPRRAVLSYGRRGASCDPVGGLFNGGNE